MNALRASTRWRIGVFAVATAALAQAVLGSPSPAASERERLQEIVARIELVTAAFQWLDATLARDFAAQSAFYPERMEAFYLWRDVPKSAVLEEKRRVFAEAHTIDLRMEPPQILIDPGARSGRMYFRKTYVIRGDGRLKRSGEVLQELRWVKEPDGWKISSERDLRVIRQARRRP